MTRTEFRSAWIAIHLAIQEVACHTLVKGNKFKTKFSYENIDRLARSYGSNITNPVQITEVMEAISIDKILHLVGEQDN